jgi:hypothetical protein
MTQRILLALGAIAALSPSPALAQEHAGNWWINPYTWELERLEMSATGTRQIEVDATPETTSEAAPSAQGRAPRGWVEIAELQGGEILSVNPDSRQVSNSLLGERIRFRGRINRPIGEQPYARTYQADCQNPDLFDLGDVNGGNGAGRLPLIPGTAAEALWQWACSN